MWVKCLIPCCCIRDALYFEMHHGHFLKKSNVDPLNPHQDRGGEGLQAKYVLPCYCIRDFFH